MNNAVSSSSHSVQTKGQMREVGLGFRHEAHRLDAGELVKRSHRNHINQQKVTTEKLLLVQ